MEDNLPSPEIYFLAIINNMSLLYPLVVLFVEIFIFQNVLRSFLLFFHFLFVFFYLKFLFHFNSVISFFDFSNFLPPFFNMMSADNSQSFMNFLSYAKLWRKKNIHSYIQFGSKWVDEHFYVGGWTSSVEGCSLI